MKIVISKILSQIHNQDDKLSSKIIQTSDEDYQITLFLKEMLCSIKVQVLQAGFTGENREIDFLWNIKP